jgi:hypothetical protein
MTAPLPPLDELVAFVAQVERDKIPALITMLAARLLAEPAAANGTAAPTPVETEPDSTLTATEVAARLGKGVRWLYRHRRELKFLRPVGKTVVASRREFEVWLRSQKR